MGRQEFLECDKWHRMPIGSEGWSNGSPKVEGGVL